jgi:hypothetical protein
MASNTPDHALGNTNDVATLLGDSINAVACGILRAVPACANLLSGNLLS